MEPKQSVRLLGFNVYKFATSNRFSNYKLIRTMEPQTILWFDFSLWHHRHQTIAWFDQDAPVEPWNQNAKPRLSNLSNAPRDGWVLNLQRHTAGNTEHGTSGTVAQLNLGTSGTVAPWHPGKSDIGTSGTRAPWNPSPPVIRPWYGLIQMGEPWNHGTVALAPRQVWTLAPVEPWHPGTSAILWLCGLHHTRPGLRTPAQ